MTIDIWLAFVATAIFLVLLPSPIACLTASFALQRGSRTGVSTVPGAAAGLSIALIAAMAPLTAIAIYLPQALETLSWIGLAYLMIYVLWSFQDPRTSTPIADNDNLPQSRPTGILTCLFRKTVLTPRYAVVLAAVVAQFIDSRLLILPQLLEIQATFLVCAAAAMSFHVFFPRRMLGRGRRSNTPNPASHKAPTRFISRRAVSAGYRRIAA